MRQIIKRIKNGQEIVFTCSQCGALIYDIFVPIGKKYEINWNKIQEKCSCGERVSNRQPIIDISDIDANLNDKNISDVRRDKNISEKSDMCIERIIDLENAISISYFDMRLNNFKRDNVKIPDNIDHLMIECIKRNISHMESNIKHLSYIDDIYEKEDAQKRLNNLKKRYNDLFYKLEDKQDEQNIVLEQDVEKNDVDKNNFR
jgi:hypothetical protein